MTIDEALLQRARAVLGTKTVRETVEEGLRAIVRRGRPAEAPTGQEGPRSFWDSTPDLEALAKEQGVSPVQDLDDLRGDFWPEDESIDDFIAAVRRWRREGDGGSNAR